MKVTCFDHSCRPNAERRFNGTKMQVFALDTIDTSIDGIFVCYTYGFDSFEKRQAMLKSYFNFECKCNRCDATDQEKQEDDEICAAFIKNEQEMQQLGKDGDKRRFHQLAMQQFDACQTVLGKYNIYGSMALFAAVVKLFGGIANENWDPPSRNDAEMLLDKVKDCISITHPYHQHYKQTIEPFYHFVRNNLE